MESILDEMNVHFNRYSQYSEREQGRILDLLRIGFDDPEHDYDPNIFDCTYVLTFYYKDHLVGCVCAMDNYDMQKNMSDFVKRRSSMHIDYGQKGCFIYNLAVLKVMRGKGIGSALVKVLCNFLSRATDYFHVQIKSDNVGSEKIFVKAGFEKFKTLKGSDEDSFSIFVKNYRRSMARETPIR